MIATLLMWFVPALIYAGFGLLVALIGLLQFRLAANVTPEWRIATSLLMVGIGALLSVAMTARSLDESVYTEGHAVLYEDLADGFAASRWVSLALLGASIVEIFRGMMKRRGSAAADPAWPVFAAMLAYYGGTMLIQSVMSEHTGFRYRELYVPIFFTALCLQPLSNIRRVVGVAKLAILVLNLASLAAIALRPDSVLHRPYVGMIPGIEWRLFGFTPHANTIGPIALMGLILELHTPHRRSWLRWLELAAAGAVFVLAQSRTAWIAGVFVAVLVRVPLGLSRHAAAIGEKQAFQSAVSTVVACIAGLILVTCIIKAGIGSDYVQSKADLGTLNGRFAIWDITLEAWRENPLFGYGPEVWGEERRLRFRMFHVGQAHNQLMQTLGEAGIAGLVLLVVYLAALATTAWRMLVSSKGLILALLILLLTRCVTESPMNAEALLSWATFLHALLLIVACYHLRNPELRLLRATARPVTAPSERWRHWFGQSSQKTL